MSPSVVTDSLRTRLPEQMIPAVLRRLDRLPLNANGKVDMPQLLLLAEKAGDDKDFVAPATPMQELLAGIWEEVLRKERVSADDNFFDLGGHSLLATQLCARVRKMLRLDLPLRYVFEFPVLSQLAARVEVIQREQNGAVARPIVAVDRSAPLPLSFAQQRLWFFEQLHPGTTTYSRPWAHRISGLLQIEKLRAALQTVLDRHEVLRTTFTVVASEPTQVVHPCGKELPFKSVDISTVPADEKDLALRQAISAEIAMPFDLEAGPLFRAMCVRLSAEEHVLVVNLHHIVTDGWSMSNLARARRGKHRIFLRSGSSMQISRPGSESVSMAKACRRT